MIQKEAIKSKLAPLTDLFKNSRNKKLLIIAVVLLFLLLTLTLLATFSRGPKIDPLPPTVALATPTPVQEIIINPSAYATDSEVLAIEEKLKEIEKDLIKIDLRESSLNPPVLDMNVGF